MHSILKSLLAKASNGRAATRNEVEAAIPLLRRELPDVMAVARIAASASGVKPFVCAIVNAKSGNCSEDCAFCAQSSRHRGDALPTPLADVDSLLERAEVYAAAGMHRMSMVTAGKGPSNAILDRVCEAAARIRERVGLVLCASLGIIDAGQARALRDAGIERYHHNLELSRAMFAAACSTHTYDERLATVANAKAAGMKVCSGGIFGCGESWADRLDFSEDLAGADPDAIPVNILIPVPGTPYADVRPIEPWEALGIVAVFRLMHPGRSVIMCAGRKSSLGDFGNWVFSAGANGIMAGDYLTRKGNDRDEDARFFDIIGIDREDRA